MNAGVGIVIVLIIIAIATLIFVPRFMLRRAIKQVIYIFRQNNAISLQTAQTVDELKLRPRGFFDNMLRTRDYKPYALDVLRTHNIVVTTDDFKLYLDEEKLRSSGFEKNAGINPPTNK